MEEFSEPLARLLESYEEAPAGHGDETLESQVQDDWAIFRLSHADVRRVLEAALPTHQLLSAQAVRLRGGEGFVDHRASWEAFSHEIRRVNRYFPKTSLDLETLRQALLGTVHRIANGTTLYRARVQQGRDPFSPDEMRAPPPELVRPGRANPVGIPYLYLAFSEATCIYETRVVQHAFVSVATFETVRALEVLNLADLSAPDFFTVEDPVESVSFFRYLRALGGELKRPVRTSDEPVDYIPTQFLCELAKEAGLEGVLYPSSHDATGHNLVLFDPDAAEPGPTVTSYEITEVRAEWTECGPP